MSGNSKIPCHTVAVHQHAHHGSSAQGWQNSKQFNDDTKISFSVLVLSQLFSFGHGGCQVEYQSEAETGRPQRMLKNTLPCIWHRYYHLLDLLLQHVVSMLTFFFIHETPWLLKKLEGAWYSVIVT